MTEKNLPTSSEERVSVLLSDTDGADEGVWIHTNEPAGAEAPS